MKKFFADFKAFIKRGNVVDMAIGVAVAGAFTKIVNAFTNGFISPLLALLSKDANLGELKWILRPEIVETVDEVETILQTEVAILWGAFLQTIIDFLIIAAALFIVMRVFNRAATRAKEAAAELHSELTPDRIKAEKEAAAKAEAEKKAAEEAAARAAAEEAAAKAAAEKAQAEEAMRAQIQHTESTEKLLAEIRDLLKAQK